MAEPGQVHGIGAEARIAEDGVRGAMVGSATVRSAFRHSITSGREYSPRVPTRRKRTPRV
jgi:hypothetical protein